jgi:hypothetical protein
VSDVIRKYEDSAAPASILSQVDEIIAALPKDGLAATIDVGVDPRGIRAIAVVKLKGGWSVQGVLDKRFRGVWSGRAQLRWAGR